MKYCEMIFCNEFKVFADKKKSSSASGFVGGEIYGICVSIERREIFEGDFILRIVIFMN